MDIVSHLAHKHRIVARSSNGVTVSHFQLSSYVTALFLTNLNMRVFESFSCQVLRRFLILLSLTLIMFDIFNIYLVSQKNKMKNFKINPLKDPIHCKLRNSHANGLLV